MCARERTWQMSCASPPSCIRVAVRPAGGRGQCYPAGPLGPEDRDIVRARCRRPISNKSTLLYANAASGKSQPFEGTLAEACAHADDHGGNRNFPAQGTERKMATPRCARPLFSHPQSVRCDCGNFSVADLSETGALSHLHGSRGTTNCEK